MRRKQANQYRECGYTLLEVVLAVGLIVAISAMAVPNFLRQIKREQLPGSARQLRSFLVMVGANAALDGKRYRLRFPEEDELGPLGDDRQPIVEREDDPIEEPDVFNVVTSPWAVGKTLLGEVWCAEVRLGRPTIEHLKRLKQSRSEIEDAVDEAFEDFEPQRLPLDFEPDGTSDWVTFVLTDAPRELKVEELEDEPRRNYF